ncbi:MAG: PD-(D/E)XK nuclease family protein [Candidatus Onthovivens sp.]|nr:PD-(D/E)XK nuclease family protein [Candidatus Onthovivens sp.]
MINFNNKILICPNELKPLFLNKKSAKPALNFKFIDLKTVQKGLFGEIDKRAVPLGMRLVNSNYLVIKKYISYIQKGFDVSKNTEISKFYSLLKSNDFIYIDNEYPKLFLNKSIYIIGYSKESNEIKHVLELIKPKDVTYLSFADVLNNYSCNLFEFERIQDEINTAFISIMDLLKKGVNPADIILITDICNNFFFLNTYANEYKIPLNFSTSKTLYDLPLSKKIENNISSLTYNQLSDFDDGSNEYKLIKSEIEFYDILNLPLRSTNYKSILKTTKINETSSYEGITVTDKLIFDDSKYIFVTNVDNSFFIRVEKNNDLLDDIDKEEGLIDSSNINNIFYSEMYKSFLNFSNKVWLSYSKISSGGSENPSYFFSHQYDKNDFEKHIKKIESDHGFSKSIEKANYSHLIYLYNNYGIANKNYFAYKKTFKDLQTYDYKFKKFSYYNDLKDYKISYSNMNIFYECPFKFFCSKVLKLDDFEDNFYSKAGNLVHEIYESLYKESFDFDNELERCMSHYNFDSREEIFLGKIIFNAKNIAKELIDYKRNSLISDTKAEQSIIVKSKSGHLIYGKIDSILIAKYEDVSAIQIIDYKTGSVENPTLNNEFGLNLQLPIYAYLLDKSSIYSQYVLSGSYYIKIMDAGVKYCPIDCQTGDFIYLKHPLKSGITLENAEVASFFEPLLEKNSKSERVSNLKFSQKTKSLIGNVSDFNFLHDSVDETSKKFIPSMLDQFFDFFIDEYSQGNFSISPFYSTFSDDTACRFCNFKDVCFKKRKDARIKQGLFSLKKINEEDIA